MKKVFAVITAAVLLLCTSITAFAAESKYKGRNDFLWGVTSHDYLYQTYRQDPELYIKTTAETGAKLFRIGFNQTLDIEGFAYLDKCVKLCDEYGMDILVLFRFATYSEDELDLNTNYFEMVASRYNGKNGHGFIDYIEVGAEEDCRMLQNKYPENGPNGDSIDHYYESDLVLWQKLYASCIKGIRNVSDSKVVIDFSHLHYAPLLYMYQRGLDFDYLGFDWYTNMGPLSRVLEPVLEKFPHDIIITETNLWAGPETNQQNIEEYNTLFEFMDLAYATPRIKALIVYELMDEPEFENWEDTFLTQEAHFGLCTANKDGTIKAFKPIYHKLKELWGGGPVKKRVVNYEQPGSEEPADNASSAAETSSSGGSDKPSYDKNTVSSETDKADTESAVTLEPKRNVNIKQIVTTNTTKVFPWVWFAVGSAVILLTGAFCLVFFVIKPPFVKKLLKK